MIFCSSTYHLALPKPHAPRPLLPAAPGLLPPALPSQAVGAQALQGSMFQRERHAALVLD